MADPPTPKPVVDFDMASASLTIKDRPRTQMRVLKDGGKEFAFFHLNIGDAPRPSDVRFGVNFDAEVTFKTPIDDNELKHWRFGFIQVAKVVRLNFTFLGRTPKEGHVTVDLGPQLNVGFVLDKTPSTPAPFINRPNADELDGKAFSSMGDHPWINLHRQLRNTKTGFLNALFKVEHQDDFVATFVGISPSGRQVDFVHVEWTTRYDADFQVVDGVVVAGGRRGGVTFGEPKQGAHPSAPFNLRPPTANDRAAAAMKAGFKPRSSARFDGLFYPPSTPDNFIFDIKSAAKSP